MLNSDGSELWSRLNPRRRCEIRQTVKTFTVWRLSRSLVVPVNDRERIPQQLWPIWKKLHSPDYSTLSAKEYWDSSKFLFSFRFTLFCYLMNSTNWAEQWKLFHCFVYSQKKVSRKDKYTGYFYLSCLQAGCGFLKILNTHLLIKDIEHYQTVLSEFVWILPAQTFQNWMLLFLTPRHI